MDAFDEAGLGRLQLRTLIEQTRLQVAACDSTGRLTLLSPPLQELFCQPFEPVDAVNYPVRFRLFATDGVTPLRPEEVPLTRARGGEVVRNAVVCTRSPQGRLSFLRCNAAPLKMPDQSVVGAVVLVQDVTADKAAEQEHEDLRNRLMETINHEFRTPLTKLLGYAEVLRDLGELLPLQARRAVDTMTEAAQELSTLLDTISQLVDLDSHTRLSKQHCDVADLIRDIAAEFAESFDSSLSLRTDAPPRLSATIDPVETRRAIWELLKNAVTYASANSLVELRAAGDSATMWLSVLDSGSGIRDDERGRLVQAFERGNHAAQPVNGKGLGLAIARTVANAHGGRLELDDRTPHGLCATLVMPRFDGAQAPP